MTSATITQTQTVADSPTDWDTTLAFQQFDPTLGSLQAVGLSLTGDIGGTVSIENLQPDAVSNTVSILGTVAASTPGFVLSTIVEPTAASGPENLGGYDGTVDYAGPSGVVVSDLTQIATASTLQAASADPGPFVGTGTVPVTVSGQASVVESGPANLAMLSHTTAGAEVTLDYQYGTVASGGGGGTGGVITQIFNPPLPAFVPDQSVATAPQTFIVPDTITDWSAALPALQFDPSLGTLEAVAIQITGDLNSSINLENLGSVSADYLVDQVGSIALVLPGSTEAITPALTADTSGALGAFDGTVDFAGTSGLSASSLISTESLIDTLADTPDLAAFAGTGTLDLALLSLGTADVTVPGNSLLRLGGSTGATIELSYIYLPTGTVPDGGSIGSDQFATDYLPVVGTSTSQSITPEVACFARGTRIVTLRGDRPIETLAIGDRVLLAEGGTAPITWIGRRRVDCCHHPKPAAVWPVRIHAHAFGPNLPARDLWLSPDHAIYAEGVLIPVKCLLNDHSITQERTDRVEYWHLELPRHAAILAENVPAESLLDTGARSAFEGGRVLQLHPDFAIRLWQAEGFAPLMLCGPEVEQVRRRLEKRNPGKRDTETTIPPLARIAPGQSNPEHRDPDAAPISVTVRQIRGT